MPKILSVDYYKYYSTPIVSLGFLAAVVMYLTAVIAPMYLANRTGSKTILNKLF
ncbi:MAG: hypothetical protein MJ252_07270 [archaeon]|nr:hypothetical protein [archaeon]